VRAKLPWILLALSLILNAAMIGGYLYERGRQDDPEQTAKTHIEMIARELALTPVEAEGLREIRRNALARRIEWRERRMAEGNGNGRKAMLAPLVAPAYDPDKMRALFRERNARRSERWIETGVELHAYLQTLTPEQRQRFVELAEDRQFFRRLFGSSRARQR
jgi:Spy/CpxP family protein refolding chaperone